MSTVGSLEKYFKIRGIEDRVSLCMNGDSDWELVAENVPAYTDIGDYGSALIVLDSSGADIALIYGMHSSYHVSDSSHAELIFSQTARDKGEYATTKAERLRFVAHWSNGQGDTTDDYFQSKREAQQYLLDKFKLTLSGAKELLRGDSVMVHENNSNTGIMEDHCIQSVSIYECDCSHPEFTHDTNY